MSSQEPQGFNSVLRKSIKQGISSVVGTSTAVAVEFYLDSSLASKDIVAFTKALENMFGAGAKLIEQRCAQALYSNLGLQFEKKENFKLDDYAVDAKKKWLTDEGNRRGGSLSGIIGKSDFAQILPLKPGFFYLR
jgi:hypothetical protein